MRLDTDPLLTRSRKILLIGEEEFFHWCLAHELESFGYDVSYAMDLFAGETVLKTSKPDLIIYDKDFSYRGSLSAFAQWMKKHPKAQSILITAATPPSHQQLDGLAAAACLCKPFPIKDFLREVEAVLPLKD